MLNRLREIWSKLEAEAASDDPSAQRTYRRLELDRESGLRLGFVSPEGILEMLIQVAEAEQDIDIATPKWKGMMFESIVLDVPVKDSKHIRLYLEDREHKPVFVTVCADLARSLESCQSSAQRRRDLGSFLSRWSSFFQRYGPDGLTPEKQRGLFGELWWLNCMIEAGVDISMAVESWKVRDLRYHDYEIDGRVLEVKTTLTKEPRRVVINNERQLDDQGLSSLHLFILTLQKTDKNGTSLPDLINFVRNSLSAINAVEANFERLLRDSGYLDVHASTYNTEYLIKKQELFSVKTGFPRLIELPKGVGDVRYSLLISACAEFEVDQETYLDQFLEG